MILGIGMGFFWIVLDQFSKIWASATLAGNHAKPVLGSLLQFEYLENTGAAFGIFKEQRLFFILLTLGVSLAILYFLWRYHRHSIGYCLSLGLILGGAVGNLLDRLRMGFVVDFIRVDVFSFFNFPIFNVADIGVTVGIFLLMFILLRTKEEKWEAIDERAYRK